MRRVSRVAASARSLAVCCISIEPTAASCVLRLICRIFVADLGARGSGLPCPFGNSRIEDGHPGTKLDTLFGIIAALDLDLKLAPHSKGGADLGEIF